MKPLMLASPRQYGMRKGSLVNNEYAIEKQLLEEFMTLHHAHPALSTPDLILRVRKAYPDIPSEVAVRAAEIFVARSAAVAKLGDWARGGLFVSSTVEQASRASIASYRARYFSGCSHILEIGTGVGSDTAALARVSKHVTTVESDPERSRHAQHNLSIQGINNVSYVVGEADVVLSSIDLSAFDALFADPARRTSDGVRVRDATHYSPPLSYLMELPVKPLRAIKVSPGLFIDAPAQGWTRQFIGFGNECLEQTLWFGAAIPDSSVYRADTETGWAPSIGATRTTLYADAIHGFLTEAHATVNRSQYLHEFFAEHGIIQIAPDVAYGVSPVQPATSSLLDSFQIIESFPFNVKALRSSLRHLGWTNRSEIKKRAFRGDPEELRSHLRLPPHSHNAPFGTIILFTWHDTPWVVLAHRVP